MITIIHGGHRKGLSFEAANALKDLLVKKGCLVKLYSLMDYKIDFCCGNQPCQDSGVCIYTDVLTDEILPAVEDSNVFVVFTPTYFNLPPAMLKNFIDRCNLLLTVEERLKPYFAAWVSGQTEEASLEQCRRGLVTFAEICEFKPLANGFVLCVERDNHKLRLDDDDMSIIQNLAINIASLD